MHLPTSRSTHSHSAIAVCSVLPVRAKTYVKMRRMLDECANEWAFLRLLRTSVIKNMLYRSIFRCCLCWYLKRRYNCGRAVILVPRSSLKARKVINKTEFLLALHCMAHAPQQAWHCVTLLCSIASSYLSLFCIFFCVTLSFSPLPQWPYPIVLISCVLPWWDI